jgi:undecaprenyl-diphosphatase
MARWLGFERTEAARFSMLMSMPAIMAAGAAATYKLLEEGDQYLLIDAMVAGAMSFVTAFFALIFMMKWLRASTFTPFVVYRLLLGAAILAWVYH